MLYKVFGFLLGALVISGCNPVLPAGAVQPTPTEIIMPASPLSTGSDALDLSPQIEQARQDLAARLALAADAIEVVEAKAVVWPDGSLGCPQPDMVYPQVLQDGFLVVLRANGQLYEYHGGGDGASFLCEAESTNRTRSVQPAVAPITATQAISITLPTNPVVVQAMKDLARRLAVRVEQIHVVKAEAVTWPDAGMGCPQPGMAYRQVQQDGMLIVLEVDGTVYNYHSGGVRPPFLCENPG